MSIPAPPSGEFALALPEFDAPPADPGALMLEWYTRAERLGIPDHLVVALATSDATGAPSNRMVLLKQVDAGGVVFTTTSTSRKGRELEANPRAATTAYWRETQQQIRLEGTMLRLSEAESDARFARRPIVSQASAIASHQGEPLDDPAALVARAAELATSAVPLPRPAAWFAYRLEPDVIEFWHGTAHRLHRRLRYDRTGEGGGWRHQRLNP